MTVDRAGLGERLAAPLWLAMVGFVLLIATVLGWISLGMLGSAMGSLDRAGRADWLIVIMLGLPILAAFFALQLFCRHLYRRDGDPRPGLAAHLRHCALLYAGLALVALGMSRCASAVPCADDFGVGVGGTALLLCGIGADLWALFRWRSGEHITLAGRE